MGEDTKISWARHTFNAWIGCTKISDACSGCYAETMAKFRGWAKWGPGEERKLTSATNWRKPLQWDKAAKAAGERRTVFCNSLADVFDAEVDNNWRAKLAGLITDTPNLDWLLLTKRHNVALKELPKMAAFAGNIRIGFTVESQPMADLRLRSLRTLAGWGYRTFVSYEPALGHVEWLPWLKDGTIGWLIAGGESGAQARPAHPDWFRAARDACVETKTPFHLKQWGEWAPGECASKAQTRTERVASYWEDGENSRWDYGAITRKQGEELHRDDGPDVWRLGKKHSGAMLDGRLWREFPS